MFIQIVETNECKWSQQNKSILEKQLHLRISEMMLYNWEKQWETNFISANCIILQRKKRKGNSNNGQWYIKHHVKTKISEMHTGNTQKDNFWLFENKNLITERSIG